MQSNVTQHFGLHKATFVNMAKSRGVILIFTLFHFIHVIHRVFNEALIQSAVQVNHLRLKTHLSVFLTEDEKILMPYHRKLIAFIP